MTKDLTATPASVSHPGKVGNANGLRTGMALPKDFDIGRVPKRFSGIKRCVGEMIDRLHAAAMANGMPIGPWQLGLLQECGRQELRARLLGNRFTADYDTLTVEQTVSLQREICNATHARNRCLQRLGLDTPQDALSRAFDDPNYLLYQGRLNATQTNVGAND